MYCVHTGCSLRLGFPHGRVPEPYLLAHNEQLRYQHKTQDVTEEYLVKESHVI